jgi:hypothetical protein
MAYHSSLFVLVVSDEEKSNLTLNLFRLKTAFHRSSYSLQIYAAFTTLLTKNQFFTGLCFEPTSRGNLHTK